MGGRSSKCLSRDFDTGLDASAVAGLPTDAVGAKEGAAPSAQTATPSASQAQGAVQQAFATAADWESVFDSLVELPIVKDHYGEFLNKLSDDAVKILQIRTLVPLAKASYARKPGALPAKRFRVLNGYRDSAEKKGIEWRANAKSLGERSNEVWEAERRAVRLPVKMPDYYRACYEGPLHSYERGNGEWMAAFDAPSAYLLVHLHHFPNMSAQEAFDALHEELDTLALNHLAASPDRPIRCLDLGCGVGTSTFSTVRSLERAGRTGDVTGVDLSDYFITVAQHLQKLRKGDPEHETVVLEFVHGNILNLAGSGYADDSIELVKVSDVCHEIPKAASQNLFTEVARVLAPGGVLAFMGLNSAQLMKDTSVGNLVDRIATSNEPYLDQYLELDIAAAMKEAGLEVLEETWPNHAKYTTADSCSLRIIIARKALSLTLGTWTGKWTLDRRENWTPYLTFLGVPEEAHEEAIQAPDYHEYEFCEESFFMDHRIPARDMHLRFTGFLDGEWHASPYPMPTSQMWSSNDREENQIQWKHDWVLFPTCFKTTIANFAGKGKTVMLKRDLSGVDQIKYTVQVMDPDTNASIVGPCVTWFKRTSTDAPMNTVQELRERFYTGVTKTLEWRKDAIDRVAELVLDNVDAWSAAQAADNISPASFNGAAMMVKGAVPFYKANLDAWAAPQKKAETAPQFMQTDGDWEVIPEAKGVGLIISPWNANVLLAVLPLLGMLAAGNVCILKPSETARHTSRLMARLVPKYFPERTVVCVEGGKEVVEAMIDARVDHIMFTGGGEVAKKILARAAKHLTPCSLELGGKNPCFVDVADNTHLEMYAKEIIETKSYFCGQFCQAFDYCLVHEQVFDEFVNMLKKQIYALGHKRNCRLINAAHARKVLSLLVGHENLVQPPVPKDSLLAKAEHGLAHMLHMKTGNDEEAECTVPLSLIVGPPLDSALMMEEIFGPLLPVVKVASARQAADFVQQRPAPLVSYCYSPDSLAWALFQEETSSGNLAVNAGPMRMQGNMNVGYGGVGDSGYGHHIWGRAAFDDFSHHKTVFRGRQFAGSAWGAAPPPVKSASSAPEKIQQQAPEKTPDAPDDDPDV